MRLPSPPTAPLGSCPACALGVAIVHRVPRGNRSCRGAGASGQDRDKTSRIRARAALGHMSSFIFFSSGAMARA